MIKADTMNDDQPFIQFYHDNPHLHAMDLATRITAIATHFLGRPYLFEPLGEADEGIYSKLPLYRMDQFDCVTLVDTVLALTYAADFAQFRKNILTIRYANQQIDYTQRTDWFTDLEWNPHLQQLGYIKEATLRIVDQHKKPIAQLARTVINKPEWYRQKTLSNLDLPPLSIEQAQQRLAQLKAEGKKFTAQPSVLSYLPLTKLFDLEGRPDAALWAQFPKVAVIEIVRPHWRPVNPKDKSVDYGTNLNVSHVGIAIHTLTGIIFYHATIGKTVMRLPLIDYLHSFLDDQRPAPVKGIHIEEIL